MDKKKRRYHLEIQTHGKNPYGIVRTSFWKNGKVCHETICRITGLSLEELRIIQEGFRGNLVSKESYKVKNNREYGASYACVELIKSLGLAKAIYSRQSEEWVRACMAMIAGRLVNAGSKLALSHIGSQSAVWDICGIDATDEGNIDVNVHCYAAMDNLLARQDAIQKALAKKHLQDGTVILYDITSCYVEGEYDNSDLVSFGYNRDQKRGHEQIVISLLCAKDGCPVAVDVFKGNTKDETTVLEKITELKDKFGLENVIFTGDRGMITKVNFEQIDHKTIKVISALKHADIKELCKKGTISLNQFDDKRIVEVIDEGKRYCLCKNPDMAKKETKTRNELLHQTRQELDKIISCTRKCKYSKEIRVGNVIGKHNMGKFITFHGKGDDLTYTIDETKIEHEESLDGCYIIYTDVSADDITAVETVASYKSLMYVEQAFRNMKTVHLEIRPIFHKTDDRIRCHVFICALAYYVMWHMKQRLRPLMDSDGKGIHRKYTFDYIMNSLRCVRQETVDFNGVITTNYVPELNTEQSKIMKLLGVKI